MGNSANRTSTEPGDHNVAPRPRFLAAAADEVTRSLMGKTADQLGLPADRVVIGGVADVAAALAGTATPELLVLDFSGSPDPIADADALADVCDPDTLVVGIGTVNDVGLYRQLHDMGLSDYLVKPCSAEALADAITHARMAAVQARTGPGGTPETPAAETRGKRILVTGARGGVGASLVAMNLAWAFSAHHGRTTTLLDLDLTFGTAALSLDLQVGQGLTEALAAPDRIDGLFLDRAMIRDSDRFCLLAAEQTLGAIDPSLGSTDATLALVDMVSRTQDRLVIDIPRHQIAEHASFSAQVDVCVIVTDLSIAGLRDTMRLKALIRREAPQTELHIIANRSGGEGKSAELSRSAFEKGADLTLSAEIPLDVSASGQSQEHARPLAEVAKGSKAAKALLALAAKLDRDPDAPEETPKPSLLARLLHRT